jgi:hypothetical protein
VGVTDVGAEESEALLVTKVAGPQTESIFEYSSAALAPPVK